MKNNNNLKYRDVKNMKITINSYIIYLYLCSFFKFRHLSKLNNT